MDSYMYQTVGHDAIHYYAECMDLPLYRREIQGTPLNQEYEYEATTKDETEDLFMLLQKILVYTVLAFKFCGTTGPIWPFCFISTCRKSIQISKACLLARSCQITNVFEWSMCKDEHTSWSFTVLISFSCRCNRLGLKSFAYLWERDQRELLAEMADNGVQAILVKVAAMGLKPVHLGKTIAEMYPLLCELNEKYQSHVCGEGGEYETFTLDCPLFKKRIVV